MPWTSCDRATRYHRFTNEANRGCPLLEPRKRLNFSDPEVRKCYEKHLAEARERSGELCEVDALLATHDLFVMLEGPHSERVHEAIEHLLSARMRPQLRRWYEQSAGDLDPAAAGFRQQLNCLAGEQLEAKR